MSTKAPKRGQPKPTGSKKLLSESAIPGVKPTDKESIKAAVMKEYMTLGEFAQTIGRSPSRARELAVIQRSITPYQFANGGKDSPRWLVKREDVEEFKQRPRPTGRPRLGDKQNNQ